MPLSNEIYNEIQLYEQIYFSVDEPVPFKGKLKVYPVKVKDYYKFYSNLPCLTMDKGVKRIKVADEDGKEKFQEVSNPEGIGMSYMAYLIDAMENKDYGREITSQVITIFELVFHEKNGMYCPHCGHFIETSKIINRFQEIEEELKNEDNKVTYMTKKAEAIKELLTCPDCDEEMQEVFRIKNSQPLKKLCVKDEEFSPKDLEKLIAIITHQNILDYDGDRYMDPVLKEEMATKARLENKNYSAPSLEKMLVCVSISSPYTIDMLKEQITLRKLSYMLKIIDRKNTYYAQLQGMMSGMVSFKEDPKHWIFSDDKRDMSKEIMSLNDLQQKFSQVT